MGIKTKSDQGHQGKAKVTEDLNNWVAHILTKSGYFSKHKKDHKNITSLINIWTPQECRDYQPLTVIEYLAGWSRHDVARRLRCHGSTIARLAQRVATTGSVNDRPRSRRPQVTTPAQNRLIVRSHLRNRFQTSTETAATIPTQHGHVSAMTVRRRLLQAGLFNHILWT